MSKLRTLHDKVKFHKYRENITVNSGSCQRYVRAFESLLDEFGKEVKAARKIDPAARNKGQKMLIELDNRCFLIDAIHKLSSLSRVGEIYHASSDYETEQNVRIIMAQLESVLSSIHEYIVCGMVGFFLRYPNDNDMTCIRFKWQKTDYIAQP